MSAALLWFVSGSLAVASDGTLAALVGADAALFVEMREVDLQLTRLADSDLARRWRESPLSKAMPSNAPQPLCTLLAADAYVATATGVPLAEQLRGLFGEAVALALYLPATTSDPQGVLLARASSAAAIERVLKSWERVEPPLRIEKRNSAYGPYVRRVFKRDGGERSLYYAHRDRLFVLSDQEQLIQDCLARAEPSADAAQTLAASAEFIELSQRLGKRPWMTACLQPRRWDHVLQREAAKGDQQRRLLEVWQVVRSVGCAVRVENGLQAELLVLLDEGLTPSSWRSFAAPAGSPSIVQAADDRTVAAFGARVRWPWLIEQWQQLLSLHDRAELTKARRVLTGLFASHDLFAETTPHLLDDWGVLVERRTEAAARPWWAQWNILGVAFFPPQLPAAVRDGLDNALLFAGNALAADRNGRGDGPPWFVARHDAGESLQRVLQGPPHIEPGYSLSPARWVLANHADLLQRRSAANAASSRLADLAAQQFSEARLFAWMDLKQLSPVPPTFPVELLTVLSHLADQAHVSVGWTEHELTIRAGLDIDRPR